MSRRLHALHVGNFKAFAETQRIPLKPITLVFGPNSAGKSSFIHSLALAHEAQFGRDKRSLARMDIHHTDVGGSAIDLGGFRQFVHRGQMNKRVVWGAEIQAAELKEDKAHQQLAQLLESVTTLSINLEIGIRLDDVDMPLPDAEPKVESVEILADGEELLRMSRRSGDDEGQEDFFRIDRLEYTHEVFARLQEAIIELNTTVTTYDDADWSACRDAITDLIPMIKVKVGSLFPTGVDIEGAERSAAPLYPIAKGTREEDLTKAIFFVFPRSLNDLIKGISEVFSDELKDLQYLGPLRSFPARHLAFAENEDANWYAGGGYAWDVVRRNRDVRKAVNIWLGSEKLKTPYELRIKELVNFDRVRDIQLEASDSWEFGGSDDENKTIEEAIKDDFENYSGLLVDNAILDGRIDAVSELVLMDMRSRTSVTHRDVGIGISQVLPVLVMAYASRNKLLAMEQPEIHLHPGLQAELGDVFIESALGERGNTFILETHSEHLILRLLRRVREGKLSADDISVLYVQPTGTGSQVLKIRVDEDGDFIDRWPGGFFEESFQEREAGR